MSIRLVVFAGFVLLYLVFEACVAFANHIEQPNFPRKPNPETELILKMDDFDCGPLYVFQYAIDAEKFWKFYYLGDNFLHKPIVVIFMDEKTGTVKAWVDRDRDGHFEEKFDDGQKIFEKYPTPCALVGISA